MARLLNGVQPKPQSAQRRIANHQVELSYVQIISLALEYLTSPL
jgi:hypothetical protein